MELKYVQAESAYKPTLVEIKKTTVYIRKDIVEENRTDDLGNKYTMYVYSEATLSHEEFNKYSSELALMNALNSVNVTKNVSTLVEGQVIGDSNQLAIMEAIADLYEMITNLTIGGTEE